MCRPAGTDFPVRPFFPMRLLAGCFLVCLCMQMAFARTVAGRVGIVVDGERFEIHSPQHRPLPVRLLGVAAPARLQPFGDQARTRLAALVFNREVEVLNVRPDGQGGITGTVMAADPNCNAPACPKIHDVALMQLMSGMAWLDRRHVGGLSPQTLDDYAAAEFNAKLRRLGLWAGRNPVPPWQWPRR